MLHSLRAHAHSTVRVVGRAAIVLALSLPLGAQQSAAPGTTPFDPVVSVAWLGDWIGRPEIVILQLGNAESFARGHIPGAIRLDFDAEVIAPGVEGGLRMELPEPAALEKALRAKGVRQDSKLVIVFDVPTNFARAGRTFFTLEWAGLRDRVAVLDGGYLAWQASGRYIATGPGRVVAVEGDVTLAPTGASLATKDSVQASVAGLGRRLVDARLPEFYGDERDNGMPRGGRIVSAVNLPFNSVVNAAGLFKPRAELEQLVAAAGIGAADPLTTYCHIGLQASWMYLTLRALGRDVTMYDGSFDEWSRDASLPVGGARSAQP
jgi:thiosulfate/3-mercaptopyruvate sulfurtransferase